MPALPAGGAEEATAPVVPELHPNRMSPPEQSWSLLRCAPNKNNRRVGLAGFAKLSQVVPDKAKLILRAGSSMAGLYRETPRKHRATQGIKSNSSCRKTLDP